MIVYVILMIAGLLAFLFIRKSGRYEQLKLYVLAVTATGIIGLGMNVNADEPHVLKFDDAGYAGLERNAVGGSDYTRKLDMSIEGIYEGEYDVKVRSERYSEDELKKIFDLAAEELQNKFPGENESLDHIEKRVSLPEYASNGRVKAEYSFKPSNVISYSGELKDENIAEEGTLVRVDITMKYDGNTSYATFYAGLYRRAIDDTESALDAVKSEIAAGNKEEGSLLKLPDSVGERKIHWSEPEKKTDMTALFLGGAALIGIMFAKKEDEKKQKKKREESLIASYPGIVSTLQLLLSSGMTVFGAWERIVKSYLKKRDDGKPEVFVYEEMLFTFRLIQDGMGEKNAYEDFAKRCGVSCYRKLISLLVQNMRKGNADLISLLEKESENAYETMKSSTKIKGEKVQTKLLVPMMLNLAVVIVAIIVPAMMGMKI